MQALILCYFVLRFHLLDKILPILLDRIVTLIWITSILMHTYIIEQHYTMLVCIDSV